MTMQRMVCTLVAFTVLLHMAHADNMASIGVAPATGAVTVSRQWSIGSGLAGFHFMAQDLHLGGVAQDFYSITNASIPAGGNILAFNLYVSSTGSALPHSDIGSKLTPDSYSGLTSADPDFGYGTVNMYMIHHHGITDYFTVLVPGVGVSSAVTDLKPMSGPGGPGTVTGVSGYFGITFAAVNVGYGANLLYFLRKHPVSGNTIFGTLAPALLGLSADVFDLGSSGHTCMCFIGDDVGFGFNMMYFLRVDAVTGYSILGYLNPTSGYVADVANLGSVYNTLTYVPADLGFGSGKMYSTGKVNPTGQSVSFAAIATRQLVSGSFFVSPTASSGLPIALTVVAGSTGAAVITGPINGVFNVTPTAEGNITLQATQAGQASPTAYLYNMLRQTFLCSPPSVQGNVTATLVVAGTTDTFNASTFTDALAADLLVNAADINITSVTAGSVVVVVVIRTHNVTTIKDTITSVASNATSNLIKAVGNITVRSVQVATAPPATNPPTPQPSRVSTTPPSVVSRGSAATVRGVHVGALMASVLLFLFL